MAADADTPDTTLNESAKDETSPPPPPNPESVETASTAEPDASDTPDDQAVDYDGAVGQDADLESEEAAPVKQPASHVRLAMLVGLVVIFGLTALVGWLGFTAYQLHQAQQQRQLFVEVGRQGALNLTTIDWQHADTDVKRVLDSATGTFYADFAKRQQPFIDVVKKAQATSKGTITEAGLESESGDEAQVLVAVSVKTSNIGAAEQEPRAWRMRISVQKSGDEAKVSNVAFVP
jgi:Mce-associated membrane protein